MEWRTKLKKRIEKMGILPEKQIVECPFCKKQFSIPAKSDKIPQHSNPNLLTVKCPGSGCPLKE